MTKPAAKPRPRMHYLECPKCESCFRVEKTITIVPVHRCWAEEKEQAQKNATPSS